MEPLDTIAACATAAGTGGVAIVRVSGAAALAVAATVTGRASPLWPDRGLVKVRVFDGSGGSIDEGLAVLMRGPRSFTGEDVVELHVHGGAVNVGMVVAAVVAAGARLAEPGEFTRRALHNGKITLTRAEAMLAVVTAPSTRAWALAQAQLGGALATAVAALRERAAAVLAELEAMIDFPDDGLPAADRERRVADLTDLADGSAALERSFAAGRALTEGILVAVAGAVNAGKSSLVNALVGAERVVVDDEPGTTRDYVEVRAIWAGVAVTLIDTAGERDGAAAVEQRGIELGRRRAASADLVVRVVGPGEVVPPASPRDLIVASKLDLGWAPAGVSCRTSAVTGAGIEALRQAIIAHVGLADDVEAGSVVLLTERQRAAAAAARGSFDAARAVLLASSPLELAALEVRSGANALATLEGEQVGEEVLDQLFARFCIGK